MGKRILFFTILIITPVIGFSQEFKNIIAEFDGEKMTITYDLVHDNPDDKFRITVFSSHDDYAAPLMNVSNDVGNNITPGTGKRITWYLKNELPWNFNDNIQFKLVAEFMTPPKKPVVKEIVQVEFTYPKAGVKVKTGKNVRIQWEGGDPDGNYRLELMEGGDKKLDIKTLSNKYQYIWSVPDDYDKGKAYSFRLTNTQATDDAAESPTFQIKGKSKAALIAVPVTVIGAGVIYLICCTGGEDGELPEPYGPDDF